MDVLNNTTLNGGDGALARPQTKREAYLEALLVVGDKGLNTFQANKVYGDTCLHSSVSELRNCLSMDISDTWESVPCRTGQMVRVKRYWLTNDRAVEHAQKLVDRLRIKRGLKPKYIEQANDN